MSTASDPLRFLSPVTPRLSGLPPLDVDDAGLDEAMAVLAEALAVATQALACEATPSPA